MARACFAQALEHHAHAIEVALDSSDPSLTAQVSTDFGNTLREFGRTEDAVAQHDKAHRRPERN